MFGRRGSKEEKEGILKREREREEERRRREEAEKSRYILILIKISVFMFYINFFLEREREEKEKREKERREKELAKRSRDEEMRRRECSIVYCTNLNCGGDLVELVSFLVHERNLEAERRRRAQDEKEAKRSSNLILA